MVTQDPRRGSGGYGWRWWTAALAIWTVLALLSIAQSAVFFAYEGHAVRWGSLIISRFVDWYTCALFLPALVWLARRYPVERGVRARHAVMQLLAPLLFVVLKYVLLLPLDRVLSVGSRPTLYGLLAANAITELMIFWAASGVIQAAEFARRLNEQRARSLVLEHEVTQARLSALGAQIRPHFLFNTLNAVTTLMRRDVDAAERVTMQLADLLEASLRSTDGHEVSLREEVRMTERYLEIMSHRFGDRLAIEWSVESGIDSAQVPSFLLQPLVENALEHGIAKRPGAGLLRVAVQRHSDMLSICVEDNGPGMSKNGTTPQPGIGLANVRQRLEHLYGSYQCLTLQSSANGTQVVVELPYHLQAMT